MWRNYSERNVCYWIDEIQASIEYNKGVIMVYDTALEDLSERCSRLEIENAQLQQEKLQLLIEKAQSDEERADLAVKVQWYEEQIRLARQKRFGPSREKTPEQLMLFNEAEATADDAAPEPQVKSVAAHIRRVTGQREALVEELRVERVEWPLPESERICPCCQGALHKMGEQIREEYGFIPAEVVLVRHARFVYSCRHCEEHEISTPVVAAPMPAFPFPGSLASASSVAWVMNGKFVEGLPLYRQEQILARNGVELSRQTMANWMIRGAALLNVIYDRLKVHLLRQDVLHADETPLQVLHEEGRAPETLSYMWLYRSGRDGPPIALFEYQQTRAGTHPREFLRLALGYLHVDGYSGYGSLLWLILVGCWAHARRYFHEALESVSPHARKKAVAAEGLAFCNRLFAIERDLHDVSPEERKRERLVRSVKVLDEFKLWLTEKSVTVAPKTKTGQAISYCNNQWVKLNNFLLDGRLEIDNNRSERTIRPFVTGRKNWLFANTPNGAKASATIYSIVETAKENGLNPLAYLTYVFEQLPNINISDPTAVDRLLPISPNLPDLVRVPQKKRVEKA